MTTRPAATETTHDDGRFRRRLRPTGPAGIAATFIGTTIGAGTALHTALSCLYGAATRLSLVGGLRRVPLWLLATVTAAVSVVLSLIGFTELIGWVYPALGYAGMVIIVLIVARWTVRRR
ncbi:hypothetical protein ACL90Y_02060 [Micrococcus luteus]